MSSTPPEQPRDQQYNDGADDGRDDEVDGVAAEVHVNAQFAKQPAAHKRAYNAKDNVPKQAVAVTFHKQPGQPARNRPDDEYIK